jgi:hypothetical protein
MRSHITEIALVLAATLGTALISATPALAGHGQALAAGHEFIWPTANHARSKLNHNYDRGLSQRSGYQWDPWGHWGSYYGPML